jgi:predicted RNA-binding protein
MDVVMRYNCDYRRYTNSTSAQYTEKRPLFYKSAEEAQRCFNSNNMALVVVKVVSNSSFFQSRCYKDWDTEYYPEYMVVFTN